MVCVVVNLIVGNRVCGKEIGSKYYYVNKDGYYCREIGDNDIN